MSPPADPGGRAPLVGRPERAVEALRTLAVWARWPVGWGVAIAVMPRLGGLGEGVPEALRGVVFWVLAFGCFLAGYVAWTRLVFARLYLGRAVWVGDEALWVGRRRRPFRAHFTRAEGRPPGGEAEAFAVPYDAVRSLFSVALARATPPMTSVGLWYLGGDGKTREMWLHFEPAVGAEVCAELERRTGLAATRREGRKPA